MQRLSPYIFPKVNLSPLDLFIFGVGVDFLKDSINFFKFKVDNIVHHTLGDTNMFREQFLIEGCVLCERVIHVAIQVDSEKAAAVISAQRNLATRVGADSLEAEIGVAIRY